MMFSLAHRHVDAIYGIRLRDVDDAAALRDYYATAAGRGLTIVSQNTLRLAHSRRKTLVMRGLV